MNPQSSQPDFLPYAPPKLLANPHLQNLLSSFGLRKFFLKWRHQSYIRSARQLVLQTPTKVRLTAAWNLHSGSSAQSVVILIHGWEGSNQSAYLLSMASYLFQAGHDTLRLQLRDHGDTTHLNREIFNSSMIEEVVDAISEFQKQHAYEKYFLAGFSLGGNFALRVGLHTEKLAQPLAGIFAACPALDPAHTMRAMQQTFSFYDRYFVTKWKRSLRAKSRHFPEYSFLADMAKLRTLDDMNHYFIPRYTGFAKVETYFESYTLTGNCLSELQTPCLIVASKDDPIIPDSDYKKVCLNKNTRVEITLHGGHCAYLCNWRLESWLDKRAAAFFS